MVLQAIYPSTLHRDQEGIYMTRVNQSNSSLELEGAVLLLFLVHLNGSIPSVAATHVLAWLHGRSWTNSPERRGMKLPHFFSSWNRYFPTGGVNCTGGVNDHFPQSELISESVWPPVSQMAKDHSAVFHTLQILPGVMAGCGFGNGRVVDVQLSWEFFSWWRYSE